MDLNIVVIAGSIVAEPEKRTFASGTRLLRLLVAVRQAEPRRRVDVLPVSLWDPGEELWQLEPAVGDRVWVAGSVQRRFWAAEEGRRSRLELIAQQVQIRPAADIDEAVRPEAAVVSAGSEVSAGGRGDLP